MTSRKPSKAEFIAIYRLEFYKNKRNWKLASKDNTIEAKSLNILNTTYDVEDGSSSQPHLNDAFIETISDADGISKSKEEKPRKHNLSQQWLESIDIKPTMKPTDNLLESLLIKNAQTGRSTNYCQEYVDVNVMNVQDTEYGVKYLPKDDVREPFLNGAQCVSDNVGIPDYTGEDQRNGMNYCHTGNFPPFPPEDAPERQWRELHTVDCGSNFGDEDVVDGANRDDLLSSSVFLDLQREYNLVEERVSAASLDSFSEFCRGADVAPHCSELELHCDDSSTEDVDMRLVARMSSAQLAAAARRHARALALLLAETAQRRKLRRNLLERMSAEELPTHDTGPDKWDELVGGSHRQRARVVIRGGRPRLQPDCGDGCRGGVVN